MGFLKKQEQLLLILFSLSLFMVPTAMGACCVDTNSTYDVSETVSFTGVCTQEQAFHQLFGPIPDETTCNDISGDWKTQDCNELRGDDQDCQIGCCCQGNGLFLNDLTIKAACVTPDTFEPTLNYQDCYALCNPSTEKYSIVGTVINETGDNVSGINITVNNPSRKVLTD